MKRPGFLILFFVLLSALSRAQESPTPASSPGAQLEAEKSRTAEPQSAADLKTPAKPESNPKIDLTPDANGKLSQEQMQQLFRVVADKDLENDKRVRDYTYIQREVDNKLDGMGRAKSTKVKTYEILEIYGEQVQRLIAKDDKPLDAKQAAKEDAKIQKIIDKRKNESEADRKKRETQEEKDREDGRKFVTEIADAYNFTLVGTEPVGGREAWVIDAQPRPGFAPHMKDAKFLSKVRGQVWIDQQDLQLSKMDIVTIDTVSVGWVLARLQKGFHLVMEQTRVNDEVWLPEHISYKLDARVALFKNFNMDGELSYKDYKKFRTSSKIVGMSQVVQ